MTEKKPVEKIVKHDKLGNPLEEFAPYYQALFNVLDSCRDLVEYAQNKRGALWLMYAAMKHLSYTVQFIERTPDKATECSDHPERYMNKEAFEKACDYWSKQLDVALKLMPVRNIWDEFAKIYDNLIIRHTEDNLGNFDMNIPTSEEILTKQITSKNLEEQEQIKQTGDALREKAKFIKKQ